MIPIELPRAQPGSPMISLMMLEMSGVMRRSATFTEVSGCQVTEADVGVREDRSPAQVVSVNFRNFVIFRMIFAKTIRNFGRKGVREVF